MVYLETLKVSVKHAFQAMGMSFEKNGSLGRRNSVSDSQEWKCRLIEMNVIL